MSQMIKGSLLAVLVAGMLSGCGGGGGGGSTAIVSGNAATGAAIASGTVTLKCVSGTTTTATTGSDGSFAINVSGVTLPCVGRVDYKDAAGAAQKLHTFISATGTANITPVTELLVANLTGGTAVDAFDKFDATKTKGYTAAQLTAAATAVKSYLKNTLGIDTTNLPDDPVGTKFVPQSGAATGDAFDKVLDAIQAKLKAGGKTLSDVSTDLAKANGGGTPGVGTFVVSAASNAARNGSYTLSGAKFTSGADVGINAQTGDGKFEVEVVMTPVGPGYTVKRAHVWFNENGQIKFFGCDGNQVVVCPFAIGYEPLLKQILFSTAELAEVNANLQGTGPDSLVGGGETLKVLGSLDFK